MCCSASVPGAYRKSSMEIVCVNLLSLDSELWCFTPQNICVNQAILVILLSRQKSKPEQQRKMFSLLNHSQLFWRTSLQDWPRKKKQLGISECSVFLQCMRPLTIKGTLKINSFNKSPLLAINKNSLRQHFIDQKLRLEQVKFIDLIWSTDWIEFRWLPGWIKFIKYCLILIKIKRHFWLIWRKSVL